MRLIGAPSLADLNPRLVDAKSLSLHSDQAPIPPSPYVWTPPPKLVRSPEFPTTAQTRDKLMEQIAELENQLAKMDGQKRHAVPECLTIFFKLLKVIVVSLLSTVFASSKSGSLHRSAVFLIVFLVFHLCGNLTALFGRDAYNSYGHHPNTMPFIRAIECYLAVGFVVHLVSASHFTYNKRKAIGKAPTSTGLLALTGTVLIVFIALHLKAFRFSSSTRRWRHSASPTDSATDRDLYLLMLEEFAVSKFWRWRRRPVRFLVCGRSGGSSSTAIASCGPRSTLKLASGYPECLSRSLRVLAASFLKKFERLLEKWDSTLLLFDSAVQAPCSSQRLSAQGEKIYK